jgi:Heterokaryon incompatibility protein (HET)
MPVTVVEPAGGYADIIRAFPRTIRVAIDVTRALGYRFLWVNKFCIDQEDDGDKRAQILAMDLVYRAAELTIIAADGDNADAGLPSAHDTVRTSRPIQTIEIGDIDLVRCPPHPKGTIPNSKWATRAWTSQEAVLSRRRLVFTQEQTYFECDTINCCESLQENRLLLHTESKDLARAFCHPGVINGLGFNTYRTIGILKNLVKQYTARTLFFEQDSLNAFAGILNHFCFKPTNIHRETIGHFWGMPFVVPRASTSDRHVTVGGIWWHEPGNSVPTRRKPFPSFS